ncbi:MAG: septum formation initiator family protein [Bacteroidales bacterium]|nr:septum formation initiator family protein [Bacteroidales bacterium]
MKKVLKIFKNKYILSLSVFAIWILIFDENNLIERFKMMRDIRQMEQDRAYYMEQIVENTQRLKELKTNRENLEKFAREQYLMKKDNEEIFVIVEED